MRKFLIAALAVVAVLAVASVAVATNVYTVHLGSTTVRGKGTKAKPIPTGLKFGFKVEDSDPSKRGSVIERYAIGSEGLVTNPKLFPKCDFTELDDATVPAKCEKALVGEGLVKNAAGPSSPGPGGERALSDSTPCNLQLRAADRHGDQRQVREAEDRWRDRQRLRVHGSAEPEAPAVGDRQLGSTVRQLDLPHEDQEEDQGPEARLLREDRMQGRQAPRACDLHHRGHGQPAVAEVHRDQAVEVLITA
jgi:hypothetical protein